MKTVKFDTDRTYNIKKHFDKVAKRCAKHGVEFSYSIAENVGHRKVVKEGMDADFCIAVLGIDPYYYIPQSEVTYNEEVIGTDWTLVGISDFTETPIFHNTFEGFEMPESKSETKFRCSHCNSVRKRNKRFYVRKGDEVLELGSECVKSYLDINPNFFSAFGGAVWDFDPEWDDFAPKWHAKPEYDVPTLFALAAWATVAYGYKKSSEDFSTKHYVGWMLDVISGDAYFSNAEERQAALDEVAEAMKKVDVEACIKYWEDAPSSEFNDKFKDALKAGYVTSRWIGILSYSYEGYLRSIEKAKDKAAEAKETAASTHVGEIGERLDIDLEKVMTVKYVETQFGGLHLVKFLDKAGNVFTTFTNGDCYWAFNEVFTGEKKADEISVRGTVKRHSEFNGVKENQVNRVLVK